MQECLGEKAPEKEFEQRIGMPLIVVEEKIYVMVGTYSIE
jgi:hypothetical protein